MPDKNSKESVTQVGVNHPFNCGIFQGDLLNFSGQGAEANAKSTLHRR
jgi:hypothetical protein